MTIQNQSTQNSDNLTIEYFFVAVDQQRDGYKLLSVAISPNFRTIEECQAFFDSCRVHGAYKVRAGFYFDDENQAESFALSIFGGAQ